MLVVLVWVANPVVLWQEVVVLLYFQQLHQQVEAELEVQVIQFVLLDMVSQEDLEEDMDMGRFEKIAPPDDVAHALQGVIHHHGMHTGIVDDKGELLRGQAKIQGDENRP